MSTPAWRAFSASGWKQAYITALFETDKRKLTVSSWLRRRQLFYEQENCLERRVITAGRWRLWRLRF